MTCFRSANRWDRGAWRHVMHLRDGLSRKLTPLLLACGLTAAGAVTETPVADLSLGKLPADDSDLHLKHDGELSADVLAHYSAALQFESSGKLRQALEHYQAVFRADPSNAELAFHTAGLAMQFEGRDAAVKILEDAARSDPRSPAPLLNLAKFCSTYPPEDLFEKEDRPAKAIAEALAKFPGHAEVYETAVLIHLTLQEREKAIAVMNQAANQTSRDPFYWLATGRTAARVWPLGQAEFRMEYGQRVQPFFENALECATRDNAEQVTLEVVQQYLLTNELERARRLCEKLSKDYESVEARKLLYRLYNAEGMKSEALATLEQIVRQNPRDAAQQRLLAGEYDKLKEPEKVIPHLEAAIQYGGGEIADYVRLGWQLYQTRQYESMVRLGQRSVRLFPDHPLVHYQLAIAHRAREEWAPSVKHFAEAEQHAGTTQTELLDYLFYYQYGITLERLERYEDAARLLEKSITLTPREESQSAANTMNFLGYMWLEQNTQLDKAGELIVKANELLPDQPAYIDSLGWFHYRKGAFKEALRELKRAEVLIRQSEQGIQPEDAEILEHIGLTHLALGQKAQALDYLKNAQALNTPDPKARKRIEESLKKATGPEIQKDGK
ncbi:MAG: tetratricopeptide repeat protein [Prosthecobacter sp.]